MGLLIMNAEDISRFEKFIYKDKSGCWIWTGGRDSKNYGNFWFCGKTVAAHRVSYELYKGKIPDGMCACHSCDTPDCVNPDHLWLGTLKENTRDCMKKGRSKFVEIGRKTGAVNGRKGAFKRRFFTDDEVREIRKSLESAVEMARQYMVSEATIRAIKKGIGYRDVT